MSAFEQAIEQASRLMPRASQCGAKYCGVVESGLTRLRIGY